MTKPGVLVVAGLDPSGGAGLVADTEAIRAAGARPLCCAAAITIQTTRSVRGWYAVPAEVVSAQVRALADEESIGAVKLGMLATAEIVRLLAELREHPRLRDLPWVIDPVLHSSSGASLIDGGAAAYGPLVASGVLLTPNLVEAAALTSLPLARSADDMEDTGRALLARGAGAVLVKGGHLDGEPQDLLLEKGRVLRLRGKRREGTRRGTGCRLASYLAARLALGEDPAKAAEEAKAFVAAYLDGEIS